MNTNSNIIDVDAPLVPEPFADWQETRPATWPAATHREIKLHGAADLTEAMAWIDQAAGNLGLRTIDARITVRAFGATEERRAFRTIEAVWRGEWTIQVLTAAGEVAA